MFKLLRGSRRDSRVLRSEDKLKKTTARMQYLEDLANAIRALAVAAVWYVLLLLTSPVMWRTWPSLLSTNVVFFAGLLSRGDITNKSGPLLCSAVRTNIDQFCVNCTPSIAYFRRIAGNTVHHPVHYWLFRMGPHWPNGRCRYGAMHRC